jgi:hypothetical protein
MIFIKAKGHGRLGHPGTKSFYERRRDRNGRQQTQVHQIIGLDRVIAPSGESFYRFFLGPFCWAFGWEKRGSREIKS